MREVIVNHLSYLLHGILSLVASLWPRRNRLIVLCNYDGRGYGDSLAPIADEILRRKLNCKLAWLVKKYQDDIPSVIRQVKRGRFFEKVWLFNAKVFICNLKGIPYRKKNGSYYIQVWHGDMPFKYIEAECGKSLSSYYRAMSMADSERTDFVVSGSSVFSEIAREKFWYPSTCKVLEYGNPRKDVLFKSRPEEIATFKRENFGSDKVRLALYAPTFRSNIPNENCRFDAHKLHDALVKRFGGEWKVVIRLHPNVAGRENMFRYDDKVVNGTRIDAGQLLSLASELLITDYSSIVEEFVIQKKPVFLFVPDLKDYQKKERELRDFYFRLPFSSCENESSLVAAIADFDDKSYLERLERFIEADYRIFDDGHAAERVVDLIEKLLK